MLKPLTADERAELYKAWADTHCVADVARICGVHENTVLKYKRLDDWAKKDAKIIEDAAKKVIDRKAREAAKRAVTYRGLESAGLNYQTSKIKDGKLEISPKDVIAFGKQADLLEGLPDSRPDNSSVGDIEIGGHKLKDIFRIATDYLAEEGKVEEDEDESED